MSERGVRRIFVGTMVVTTVEIEVKDDFAAAHGSEPRVVKPIGTEAQVQEIKEIEDEVKYYLMLSRSHTWVTRDQIDFAPDSKQMIDSVCVILADGSLEDAAVVETVLKNILSDFSSSTCRLILTYLQIYTREYPIGDHQCRKKWFGIEPFRHGRNGIGLLQYQGHQGCWFGQFEKNIVNSTLLWVGEKDGYHKAYPRKCVNDVIQHGKYYIEQSHWEEISERWFTDWGAAMNPLSATILPDTLLLRAHVSVVLLGGPLHNVEKMRRAEKVIRPRANVDGYDFPDAGALKEKEDDQLFREDLGFDS